MSSKQGSTFGTRKIRWRLDRRRGQDDQRQSCSAFFVSRGSCKRWRERSIGSGGAGTSARRSVRKYRGDARSPVKGMAPRVSLTVDQCKAKLVVMCPLTEAPCRQKQLTSCKTEESLDDSALGGTYAREAEWEQEVLSRQSRRTIAGVMTLATNTRPGTLGTMVQVSTWTSEPLVEYHHTTKEV